MSKPTPGPWVYWNPDEWTHCLVTVHGELPNGDPNTWAVMSMNSRRDEADANARFVAGAHAVYERTGKTPAELAASLADAQAEIARLRGALDEIGALCRHLRQGGPDPMDLESLSDALTTAVDTAHDALKI